MSACVHVFDQVLDIMFDICHHCCCYTPAYEVCDAYTGATLFGGHVLVSQALAWQHNFIHVWFEVCEADYIHIFCAVKKLST